MRNNNKNIHQASSRHPPSGILAVGAFPCSNEDRELFVQRELRGVWIFEGVRRGGTDREARLQGAHDRKTRGGGGVPHGLHGGRR